MDYLVQINLLENDINSISNNLQLFTIQFSEINAIRKSLQHLETLFNSNNFDSIYESCKDTVQGINLFTCSQSLGHRNIHSCISKFGKSIDKNFNTDYNKFCIISFSTYVQDSYNLDLIIQDYLIRQGYFDSGEILKTESSLESIDNLSFYLKINEIYQTIQAGSLDLALAWCFQYRDILEESNSILEFKLFQQRFFQLLEQNDYISAIKFAQSMSHLLKTHVTEVQRVIGCLAFVNKGLSNLPYINCKNNLNLLSQLFKLESFKILSIPVKSILGTTTNAGCRAIPIIIEMAPILIEKYKLSNFLSNREIPIELELGSLYWYHSAFSCPILKQQVAKGSNLAVRLKCGHAISQESMRKINTIGHFKCPYCPMEMFEIDVLKIAF